MSRAGDLLFKKGLAGGAKGPKPTITASTGYPVPMTVTFDKDVTGFAVGDITISAGGSLASFTAVDAKTYTVAWTPAAGANTMDIAAGVCVDAAGKSNTAAAQFGITSLTLQPDSTTSADTQITNVLSTSNFATQAWTFIGKRSDDGRVYRTIIKFDLSSVPAAATVYSTLLSLYRIGDFSTNARTYRVYRLKLAWVLGQVTWLIWKTGSNWNTQGAFGADDCEQTEIGSRDMTATEAAGFKDFPLAGANKAALDLGNGWLIKADTEDSDGYQFDTSESTTAAQRPKLRIVYQTVP